MNSADEMKSAIDKMMELLGESKRLDPVDEDASYSAYEKAFSTAQDLIDAITKTFSKY